MKYVRTALYLDFDNVFTGLFRLDPAAAIQFASEPGVWLHRLSTTLSGHSTRRWLVLRCYLNPSGWVGHRDAEGEPARLYFSRFRPSFVRAGFEVIDCPRYNATKNGADIRIVVDAVDALSADTVYEEFVIASGDSDMTPLLQRLRRSDRRTMIVSPADTAEAFSSIADLILDSQQLLALVQGEPVDVDDEADAAVAAEFGDTPEDVEPVDQDQAYEAFRTRVVAEYEKATAPLVMATLAHELRAELGAAISATNWFGYGAFARAVGSLKLPDLQMSQHQLWDETRHSPPEITAPLVPRIELPDPVERLAALINLPRLPREWWQPIYHTLSEYVHSHTFNLTQCTSWSRDRLREQGLAVNRNTVAFIARGSTFGGCPLYTQPPPSADEIGSAFVNNVLNRTDTESFTEEELTAVRTWLGAHPEDEPDPEPELPT
ncbi:NYN domain-containing protein [Thermomonospora umbrina]|uniref:NYN domain-containing protein n=1 Tax=Thermomonospora umbrina TaxID=111806 RepID=A0A3D9SUU8_9ACTN|nr:NYN domain-containing protein [Thermomonospora umbrina]REE98270.1 NYN domain-containing protein [Thermomonospora umbrina]